jgi:hypothetical protein
VEPPVSCQSCRQAITESSLVYRKGNAEIHNQALLQCDICERFACAECLRVYDILSGYDFLCHECARGIGASTLHRGH